MIRSLPNPCTHTGFAARTFGLEMFSDRVGVPMSQHRIPRGGRMANARDHVVPRLAVAEDLHLDPEEIYRHILLFRPRESDGVLFRRHHQFHVTFDAALHEPVNLPFGEAVMVGETPADFHPRAQLLEAALKTFRYRDAT